MANKDITVVQLYELKRAMESEIEKEIQKRINKFCDETGLDVNYVDVNLTYVKELTSSNLKYLVSVAISTEFNEENYEQNN